MISTAGCTVVLTVIKFVLKILALAKISESKMGFNPIQGVEGKKDLISVFPL